jgi:hypothetical protein
MHIHLIGNGERGLLIADPAIDFDDQIQSTIREVRSRSIILSLGNEYVDPQDAL